MPSSKNNRKPSAAKRAFYLAIAALAVSSAVAETATETIPIAVVKTAAVKGGSSASAEGPDAMVTSGNGAIAFRKDGATDWSVTNSATWYVDHERERKRVKEELKRIC